MRLALNIIVLCSLFLFLTIIHQVICDDVEISEQSSSTESTESTESSSGIRSFIKISR